MHKPNTTNVCYFLAIGFGRTQTDGSVSDVLKEGALKIVANAKCSSEYGRDILESKICAQSTDNFVCNGDSGGALLVPKVTKFNFFATTIVVR